MDSLSNTSSALAQTATNLAAQLLAYLPKVLAALLVLLVGLVVARLLRALATRAALGVDRLVQGLGSAAGGARPVIGSASARIFGDVIFWVVALGFVAAATQLLGLELFTTWLSDVIRYVPTVLVGVLIVGAGVLLGSLARDMVVATSTTTTGPQRALLGRIVQAVILGTAILVGAEQIGIKVTFLVLLAGALGGVVAATIAVSVSLGARGYVADLIGARRARAAFSIGQTIRVGDLEGRILDITAVAVVLEVPEGRAVLPASQLAEQAVIVRMGGG